MSNAGLKTRPMSLRKPHHQTSVHIPNLSVSPCAVPEREDHQHELAPARAHAHWYRSDAHELVNAITHGAGLLLAVVGSLVMGAIVLTSGDVWRVAGCGVFVASMIAVYAASTLSHSRFAPPLKNFFRRVDQGVIYLLVVATYTPFGLAYLRTGAGWLLLAALWMGALAGCLSKMLSARPIDCGPIWTYVALGVLPTITIPWLWPMVPAGTSLWMFLGGMFYLVGTIFLINDVRVRHFHAVWHLLVIAGSTCHFLGILVAVARAG